MVVGQMQIQQYQFCQMELITHFMPIAGNHHFEPFRLQISFEHPADTLIVIDY